MLKRFLAVSLALAAVALPAKVLKKDNYLKAATGNWLTQPYWSGTLKSVTVDNVKCIELASALKNKREFGRMFAGTTQDVYFNGTKLRIDITAKGSGTLQLGVITYEFAPKTQPKYIFGKPVTLTGEFAKYSVDITLPSRLRQVFPVINIEGKGSKVIIKAYQFVSIEPAKGVEIEAQNPLQIVDNIANAEAVTFKTNLPNKTFTFCQRDNSKLKLEKSVKSDANGIVKVTPEAKGVGTIELSLAHNGNAGLAYIFIESPADFARTAKLAKSVKLPKKQHFLFIADSLTDFYRGYNYVDRLNYWLNKYNPGKFTVRNAAVRGDYTTRVLDRLQGVRSTFMLSRYKDLFKEKYDKIFIFLGQNDTRCRRTQNFSKPFIPPAQQEKDLRQIIAIIKKHSDAQIIFISPSPSYVKTFEDRHAKWPKNREIYMYGKKEFVDAFDAVNRKLCKEFKFDYVDILKPMRAVKNMKGLYQPDAVHLSIKGGQVIADELLKYLAK